MNTWAAVQELYQKRMPKAQIARELGIARNTVKKLIKQKEEPKYKRENYPSKMEPYLEQIIEWRTSKNFEYNGTRIYRELKNLGYKGSISPVYRVLKRIDQEGKCEIPKTATIRIETPSGDQAQFDWSPYEVFIGHQQKRVYCFCMILAASRKKAVCFSLTCNGDAIYEAIQELFEDLGGVTLELLIDNPTALVIKNNYQGDDEIQYNSKALLIAAHLGTELNACNCYWPRTKGKIEKTFQYIEEQFIKGTVFPNMEMLSQLGKAFIAEWNSIPNSTTRRIPDEYYEIEEKKVLLPLPEKRLRFRTPGKRVVSNDSLIPIDTNCYSLPVCYVGQTVLYRIIYGFRIEVYTQNETLILSQEVSPNRHDVIKQDKHYEAIAPIANKSIPQIRRDFTKLFKNGQKYLEEASHHFQQPTYHARKILELTELYHPEDLDQVLAYGLAHQLLDIKSIKRLLRDHYFEIVMEKKESNNPITNTARHEQDFALTRSCDYYELQQEVTPL